MNTLLQKLLLKLAGLIALALFGGILSATLVRFSPGYGIDERELDPGLSHSSVDAIRLRHRANSDLFQYYKTYLFGLAQGDLGTSEWLQIPVRDLVRQRFPLTAKSVAFGVLTAWTAALLLTLAGLFFRGAVYDVSTTLVTSFLVGLPYVVVALFFVYLRAPVFLAISTVLFPKLFRYMRNLVAHSAAQPCVLAARARGIKMPSIIWRYVIRLAAPMLLSLFGVSVSMAFGAAIPIEALCDSPGLGQLAWQAALNRDLSLIVNLTLILTLITVAANWLASIPHPAPAVRPS